MFYIGKSNKYYTLWQTDEVVVVGSRIERFLYCRNLSFDLNEARKKAPSAILDENLRGTKPFWRDEQKIEYPDTQFAFGRYAGEEFENVDDFQYMKWYFEKTKNEFAKNRLLENGYKYYKNELMSEENYNDTIEIEKYNEFMKSLEKGHHYSDKEKVELELKEINSFSFKNTYSYYSYTYVVTYASKDGKMFKYLGTSPNEDISKSEYTKVKATIKHSDYNGIDETRLLRIKVL